MDNSWTPAKTRNRKRKKTKSRNLNDQEDAKQVEELERQPILNPVFTKESNNSVSEPDPWKVVSSTRKKKKKETQSPVKEAPKPVKQKETAKEQKSPRELDEIRARNALQKGDTVRVYRVFYEDWYEGEVLSTAGDDLKIDIGDSQVVVKKRNSPQIFPIFDDFLQRYLPVESPKKIKKQPQQKSNKQPKKKKKKPQQKKLSKEEDILENIDRILRAHNMTLGVPEILNNLKDSLQGGSWKNNYKRRFGSMKKFLLKHPDRYKVEDDNGNVVVEFLDPEPVVEEIAPEKKSRTEHKKGKAKKEASGFAMMVVFMLGVCIFLLGLVFTVDHPQILEIRTVLLRKAEEIRSEYFEKKQEL